MLVLIILEKKTIEKQQDDVGTDNCIISSVILTSCPPPPHHQGSPADVKVNSDSATVTDGQMFREVSSTYLTISRVIDDSGMFPNARD